MTDNKPGYPSNSKKAKAESEAPARVPREKIITKDVRQKRKSLGHKMAENFAGDDMRSVGSYILFDVAVPALKSLISEAVSQGVERMLFGDSRGSRRHDSGRTSGTRYSNISRPSNGPTGRAGAPDGPHSGISDRGRTLHDFREVVLPDRGEAQQVLRELEKLIDEYNIATVTDFYDFVGITSDFQDLKWGWEDLSSARVERVRDGFILDLPRPTSLD